MIKKTMLNEKKNGESGAVVLLTVLVVILIIAVAFFAVLYFTDSELLRSNKTNIEEKKENISYKNKDKEDDDAKDELVEITGAQFKSKLEKLDWEVYDYTSLLSLDSSEESEGITSILMASKDEETAIFVVLEDESQAMKYYADRLIDIKNEDISIKKSIGDNYESVYAYGEPYGTETYLKLSRVGKTVLAIETQDKKEYKKIDKELGY